MKLSIAMLGALLLALGTAVHAQAPKARDAVKACAGKKGADHQACIKQVCAKAQHPGACEKHSRGQEKEMAAEEACKDKKGKDHLRCVNEHAKKK